MDRCDFIYMVRMLLDECKVPEDEMLDVWVSVAKMDDVTVGLFLESIEDKTQRMTTGYDLEGKRTLIMTLKNERWGVR